MKKLFSLAVTCFLLCLTAQTWATPNAPILSYETNGLTVTVSWTEVVDAHGYTLYFAPFPYTDPSTINSIDLGSQTSLSATLPEGSAYIVAVTAYGSSGEESIISNTQSFTLEKPVPGVPVLSYDIDGMNITVSWTNVPDASGYKLYYASAMTPDTYTGLDVGNKTNISFSLWDGASFSLKISAYNTQGESAFSGVKNFTVIADLDRDGFGVSQGDCNDNDSQIKPGATDLCGDGIDQDCSGSDQSCSNALISCTYSETNLTYCFEGASYPDYFEDHCSGVYSLSGCNIQSFGYCEDGNQNIHYATEITQGYNELVNLCKSTGGVWHWN